MMMHNNKWLRGQVPASGAARSARRLVARRLVARRRGSVMVESAFTIFALLVLTFGLLQAGLIYNAMLSLNNLAREGARYAAVRAKTVNDPAMIRDQVSAYLQGRARGTSIEPAQLDSAHIVIQAASLRSSQPMRVVILYDMKRNKGFVPALLPLPPSFANYQASATNLIE